MNTQISRTIRLMITPFAGDQAAQKGSRNTFGAWPTPTQLGAWLELEVAVTGAPDPRTGYILGINEIDAAVRASAITPLSEALTAEEPLPLPELLAAVTERIEDELKRPTTAVRMRLTPRHELTWARVRQPEKAEPMNDREHELLLRDQFEFAAAHRLHDASQDADWNQKTFGKCNNPAGHGHNYKVEVLIASPIQPDGTATVSFEQLERIVDQAVIERFDHKHLNEDCPEFAERNPSVENITLTCHDLLEGPIAQAGGTLRSVTVWETEKTSCTYPVNA